jgi:3-hydroxyacyl-[acyl-carrier-protein] dehydratase
MTSQQTLVLSVAADHPAYAGHFPGRPILPGVVLLDEALHALAGSLQRDAIGAQIKSAKFLSPVVPGETLSLRYSTAPSGDFRCEILVNANQADERLAASAIFALAAPEGEAA